MTQASPLESQLPVDTPATLPRPADNSPIADPQHVGQAGDMHFGAQILDSDTGLDAFQGAALKDEQRAQGAQAQPKSPSDSATGEAEKAIEIGKSQLGVQYVYGAHQPGKALDCSGFTQYVMGQLGIQIGGNTYTQVTQGVPVQGGIGSAKPGDLLFTTGDVGMRANGHVALYIGGGKVIAAPHTGTVVQIQDWSNKPLTAIRRYF